MVLILSIMIIIETIAIIILLAMVDWHGYDGDIDITIGEDDRKTFQLSLDSDPMLLANKKVVKFRVNEIREANRD